MKNLSVALLAAAALSTSAMANNGFYLGASAGVAQTNAKYDYANQNLSAVSTFAASQYQQSFKNDAGKTAGLFGLFAGYGAVVGSGAYIGGEIYGGIDTTSFKPFDDSASGNRAGFWTTKLERKYYYGLAARLGYMITPNTLAYIRLAVESGKWKATVTPNAATVDGATMTGATADQIAASKKAQTKNKSGLQFAPGLGVEVYVSKNLFIRAEYSYLFGPKLSLTHDTTAINGAVFNGSSVNHNLKTSQHAMKVGIGYKF